MYLQLSVTGKDLEPIPFHAKFFLNGNIEGQADYPAGDDISFQNLVEPLSQYEIELSAKGRQTKRLSLEAFRASIDNTTNIAIVKLEKETSAVTIALVGTAFYLMLKKKKEQVGGITTAELMPWIMIGVAVLGFSFIRKILESLGIWDSRETKELDSASTDPNNFWNPLFFTTKPTTSFYTYSISRATADTWAKEIRNAFGAVNDCEECAIAVFKRCKTKSNASFISYAFNQMYGEDLLTFLRGGFWPQDRLSDSDVSTINNYINQLPNW